MSLGYYTTDTLIEAIKRKAMLPQNQVTFTVADFLAFANEELKIGIAPSVLSMHEEYYVFPQTVPLVMNKTSYEIPYRALGGKLRDVFYRNEQGSLIEMSRISPDDKSIYQQSSLVSSYIFYYIEGNSIVLSPPVNQTPTGSLIFTFFIRPNDLVVEDRVAIITNISTDTDAGTTTYTVDGIPTGFSTSTNMDLLQYKPGHKIRNIDINPVSISGTNKTITFNSSVVDSDTEVGDQIAFAGECMIPQCPTDLHPVLAQRVAARCLEALGDTQGLTNANAKLQEMEVKSIALIDNRVDGSPQKVVNNRGLLGRSKMRRKWWF